MSFFPSTVSALAETLRLIISRPLIRDPSTFSLPDVDFAVAMDISGAATSAFASEQTLLTLTGEFVVVGDLHGHVLDFLRILMTFRMPPVTRYILLGDLIDHGGYSVHTCLYALALKALFPADFYIIRGNHEFRDINSTHGLLADVQAQYGSAELFESLNRTFALIPLAARVNGDILCIHGGLGPGLTTLGQIAAVQRPLVAADDVIVESLIWSDPNPGVTLRRSTTRMRGYEFGEGPVTEFLAANKLRLIVRGHEAIADGVKYQLNRKIVTVFSVSNYCGHITGVCGVLRIRPGMPEVPAYLPTLPYVYRRATESLGDLGTPVTRARQLSCTPPAKADRKSGPPITVFKTPNPRRRARRNSSKDMDISLAVPS
jgi:diadenosine tetraphosphatase ApaH/serine/threonine PP2A family protein phosphatase